MNTTRGLERPRAAAGCCGRCTEHWSRTATRSHNPASKNKQPPRQTNPAEGISAKIAILWMKMEMGWRCGPQITQTRELSAFLGFAQSLQGSSAWMGPAAQGRAWHKAGFRTPGLAVPTHRTVSPKSSISIHLPLQARCQQAASPHQDGAAGSGGSSELSFHHAAKIS